MCGPSCLQADPGTRAGLHSQTLISTGMADLDRLLGGGLPLGSILLVVEDGSTQNHAVLMRYFLAEGVACGQRILWGTSSHETPIGGPAKALPAEAKTHGGKQQVG